MTKIIGLTGGIGSGKSTVAKVFKELGIPVYDSDTEAKKLINTSNNVISKMKQNFGDNIYLKNNILNKKKLSQLIFNDKKLLNIVNTIVHPAVKEDFNTWAKKQTSNYIIKEAAILFESGAYKDTDLIITVTAPEELRIQRVCKRDNKPAEKIKEIINNQISESEKINRSDYVIYNDEEQLILPQILKIDDNLQSAE